MLRAMFVVASLALATVANGFSKADRSALTEALAAGRSQVVLMVLAKEGQGSAVAARIEALGGKIRWRQTEIDYLRAAVPVDQIERIVLLEGIEQIEADQHKYFWHSAEKVPTVALFPPPGKDTPAVNPYLPTHWLQAPQFMAKHPTYDGRGVTVAAIDSTIDTAVPELQRALTLDGKAIPKIRDYRMATDPFDDADLYGHLIYGFVRQPTWVALDAEVQSRDGFFDYEGKRYHAPHDGHFRIGYFNERFINRPPRVGDVNRDGNPPGSSGLFAVLWDEQRGVAWVDVNQDSDFTAEKPMMDFSVRRDLNAFGRDLPETPLEEREIFALDIEERQRRINISLLGDVHGTMVAGILAGHDYFGGAVQGMAPAAELIAFHRHDAFLMHHILESALVALHDPAVEILQWSEAAYPELTDGSDLCSRALDRMLRRFPKPTMVAASNQGPQLSTIGTPSLAREAFSIGSFTPNETWRANFGVTPSNPYVLPDSSASGPADDGGLRPSFLTLSNTLTTNTLGSSEGNKSGSYALPVGYMVGGGTSSAAPFASGVVALLLSASKQADVPFDLFRLRRALLSSARFLPGIPAYRQGAGLAQVDKAWDMLVAMKDGTPPLIACEASVRTQISHRLATPHRGTGFFEREGWTAGQRGKRQLICERLTGADRSMPFAVKWLGNDGTFSSAARVTLPLKKKVALAVDVNPATPGAHSALLQLSELGSPVIAQEVLHTVVAAHRFSAQSNYTLTLEDTAPKLESRSFFLDVPPGTALLSAQLQSTGGSLKLSFHPPAGKPLYRYPRAAHTPASNDLQQQQFFPRPQPGVWEITISNSSDGPAQADRAFKLIAALGSAQMNTVKRTSNMGTAVKLQMRHRQAPLPVSIQARHLGYASRTIQQLVGKSTNVHYIEVPTGASLLEIAVEPLAREQRDLDLYLYDCSGVNPVLTRYANGGAAEERITLVNPSPGRWCAVVDAPQPPDRSAGYQLFELIQHPAFGDIDLEGSGSIIARPLPRRAPPPDRHLAGYIEAMVPQTSGQNQDAMSAGRILLEW